MTQAIIAIDQLEMSCRVCGGHSQLFDTARVLRKHEVRYFRCVSCGFIQTEPPYWLDEAYSSAIARQDVGAMQRNLVNRELATSVLSLILPHAKSCVDYGAGHGVFVRLMRDRGFNFFWYDRHASNDYARGFEYQQGQPCDFVTAFEVLEHLADPVADLSAIMDISENVFVSTSLLPEPAPKVSDWWYFLPSSGQHISFYTATSLKLIADRFQRHLVSHGSYHLFTTRPTSQIAIRLATSFSWSRILNLAFRRVSLIDRDHEAMIG